MMCVIYGDYHLQSYNINNPIILLSYVVVSVILYIWYYFPHYRWKTKPQFIIINTDKQEWVISELSL